MDYIIQIEKALTVAEILGLVALAQVDTNASYMAKVFKAAESRLILDCNVDLTPYSEDDLP